MPPALNDILIAHPSPAAVSRFRLDRLRNDFCPSPDDPDEFSFNVWSSGLWVSTPTGATGVMASAGGDMGVDVNSRDLQYLVREHLVGENDDVAFVRDKSHGFVDEEHHLKVRWNSQHGRVYIDGHHTAFDLELGDQVLVSSHAAPLRIFSQRRFVLLSHWSPRRASSARTRPPSYRPACPRPRANGCFGRPAATASARRRASTRLGR